MRPGIDTDTLELARARLRLAVQGEASRTIARHAPTGVDLRDADPALLISIADPQKRARVVMNAAAAHHADEIARVVSSAARAELAVLVDDEARRFALKNRGLVTAKPDDAPFADRFGATKRAVENRLMDRLSGADVPDKCLDAAVSA